MVTTDHAAYIQSLRELADFLTRNPDAPMPTPRMNVSVFTNDRVTAFGALDDVQLTPEADDEGNLSISVNIGSIEYYVYGYANWDEHYAAFQEKQARTWAEKNGKRITDTEPAA